MTAESRFIQANRSHCLTDRLSLGNERYAQACERFFATQLALDLPPGETDISTFLALNSDSTDPRHAILVLKDDALLAGLEELSAFLSRRFDVVSFHSEYQDGDRLKKGDVLLELVAPACELLVVERVIVNFMQRMCGVATYTGNLLASLVPTAPDVLLCTTRKTFFGPLDKKAAMIAGAGTHRVFLSDAVLLKENHFAASTNDFSTTVGSCLEESLNLNPLPAFFEVEVESEDQLFLTLDLFHSFFDHAKPPFNLVLMMDNFDVNSLSLAVSKVRGNCDYDSILLEASGGISEKNLADYAGTGVDIISMGALTNQARAVDISMLIK